MTTPKYTVGVHGSNVNRVLSRDTDLAQYLATELGVNVGTYGGLAVAVEGGIDINNEEIVVEGGTITDFMCRGQLDLSNGKVGATRGTIGKLVAADALVQCTTLYSGGDGGEDAYTFTDCTGFMQYVYAALAVNGMKFTNSNMRLIAACDNTAVTYAIAVGALCHISILSSDTIFRGKTADIMFCDDAGGPTASWPDEQESVTDLAGAWVFNYSTPG